MITNKALEALQMAFTNGFDCGLKGIKPSPRHQQDPALSWAWTEGFYAGGKMAYIDILHRQNDDLLRRIKELQG